VKPRQDNIKYFFTGLCIQTAGNSDVFGLGKPKKQISLLILGSDSQWVMLAKA